MNGCDDGIVYAEGFVVTRGLPLVFEHAWVVVDDKHCDLTITDTEAVRLVWWTVPRKEMILTLALRKYYGPIREKLFHASAEVAWRSVGIDFTTENT